MTTHKNTTTNTPRSPLRNATRALLAASLCSLLLQGCGGGGSEEPASAKGQEADEALTVTVTDATGKTVTAVASADGQYQADLAGLTAPLRLSATLATENGAPPYVWIDTTPMTDAADKADTRRMAQAATTLPLLCRGLPCMPTSASQQWLLASPAQISAILASLQALLAQQNNRPPVISLPTPQ